MQLTTGKVIFVTGVTVLILFTYDTIINISFVIFKKIVLLISQGSAAT